MTLNLPLLYVLWLEEYYQISPSKNRSPNLWHVTSILVCCIFAYNSGNWPTMDFNLFSYLNYRESWKQSNSNIIGVSNKKKSIIKDVHQKYHILIQVYFSEGFNWCLTRKCLWNWKILICKIHEKDWKG